MKKSSTLPKGATSYKETSFGVISREKLLLLEIQGTKKGLDYIHKIASENLNIVITPSLINKIHGISYKWIFPKWAGKYRNIRVEFSGKEALFPHLVPELIINLCEDLKERLVYLKAKEDKYIESVILLLAWFQHRFVWIHPFQDYNGRVARMLTILILLKLGLPPIEIKAETGYGRKKYLEAMYCADLGDYSKLMKLIGNALNESLSKV